MSSHDGVAIIPEALREQRTVYAKEAIQKQFDAFAEQNKIPTFRDRLRIGFNETAILAFEKTNGMVKEMVAKLVDTPAEAERVYQDLVSICVGMQQAGPWGYAKELENPTSPEMRAWYMLAAAQNIGYEREMDLNEQELVDNIKRIEGHLASAAQDPEAFFARAKDHILRRAEAAIRFDEADADRRVPIGEGFGSYLPMAIKGYDAGVVQDAEGWVFVGAREPIEDSMLEAMGLQKEVGPDDRNPSRTVTYFKNASGQKVIKKPYSGLLIILSRSFDLASSIVKAINSDQETVQVAEDALGHIRVAQTTEKAREELGVNDVRLPREFMRALQPREMEGASESTALTRPREEFYRQLLFVRGNYVFMDALLQLQARRKAEGKEVTEHEKQVLGDKIWSKMAQKVEELQHVNSVIDEAFAVIPEGVNQVIDMAGGAGDLGLAVTNEFLSLGREVVRTEIVDPQEGVADFMETIITHLPFRETLERIAVHNTGYLQDAHITPDSVVVAKHACGTLTDAILEQWRDSDSKMLVAMTCCQGKAKGEPARYGFSQQEWDQLCAESDLTNTAVPDAPGKARERALERLERGNRAMKKLDMARVEYLRRHGFKAELSTTDKFPKGDVIVARRLPKNFMNKLREVQALEKINPRAFDALLMKFDAAAAGGSPSGFDRGQYGDEWTNDDFAEMGRRFVSVAFEERVPVQASEERPAAPDAGQERPDVKKLQKERMRQVFMQEGGRIDLYVMNKAQQAGKPMAPNKLGPIVAAIRERIFRDETQPPADVRTGVDVLMVELGY